MRRVVIHRAGGYERLRLEEGPDPAPGPGEVALAVEAAGVNYADCVIRMGLYASAKEYVGWPITPGFEVAGKVAARGDGVDEPAVGTDVLAVTRFGGYASRVVVPRHQVFVRPPQLDSAAGAGFPTVFLTAYHALFELAHPRPGSRLLVHSAAGGVGGALVQLGKVAETTVVGVVGAPHKVEVARGLGADHVIDKSSEDLWPAVERHARHYDVVLDGNGVATLEESYRHVAPAGRLVSYGFHSMFPRRGGRPHWPKLVWGYLRTPRFHPLRMVNDNRSVLAFNLSYLFDRRDLLAEAMARLFAWLDEGRLRPPPLTRYPVDRVADAHRDLESGRTVGKLVLTF
ncbi:MAG: synaptic vesicle VAT-1 family membrane protein [Planctomycetota bacterium]|jgi:NADPH:quinone reductase-like Zn-dependent oxidoreductase